MWGQFPAPYITYKSTLEEMVVRFSSGTQASEVHKSHNFTATHAVTNVPCSLDVNGANLLFPVCGNNCIRCLCTPVSSTLWGSNLFPRRSLKKSILTFAQLKIMALAKLVPSRGRRHTADFFSEAVQPVYVTSVSTACGEISVCSELHTDMQKFSDLHFNTNSRDKHVVSHIPWVILPVYNETPYYVVCGTFAGFLYLNVALPFRRTPSRRSPESR
jgi:hypothetical protein